MSDNTENTQTAPASTTPVENTTPSAPASSPSLLQADKEWTFDAYTNESNKDFDSKEFDDTFIQLSKDNGLTKEQAQAIRKNFLDGMVAEEIEEEEAKRSKYEKDLIELKDNWGDKFNFKVNNINKLLLQLDNNNVEGDFHKYLSETGLDADVRFVKFMDKIVEIICREDQTKVSKQDGIVSPDTIQDEINKLVKSPAYFDSSDSTHADIVQRVQALYEKLYN